jgi:heterodisulfide reductase subunit D
MPKCNECGMCKENCPVYRALKRESVSPRGFAILQKKEVYDKIVYLCSLCGNCKEVCPYGVDLKLQEFREKLVENRVESSSNKKVIDNLRKYGNPYGAES